jgi:hypothetical protein
VPAGLAAVSVQRTAALGRQRGARIRRLGRRSPEDVEPPTLGRCHARSNGFDLHAGLAEAAVIARILRRLGVPETLANLTVREWPELLPKPQLRPGRSGVLRTRSYPGQGPRRSRGLRATSRGVDRLLSAQAYGLYLGPSTSLSPESSIS